MKALESHTRFLRQIAIGDDEDGETAIDAANYDFGAVDGGLDAGGLHVKVIVGDNRSVGSSEEA